MSTLVPAGGHPLDANPQELPGRPHQLTPALARVLVAALRASGKVNVACDHARISRTTYHTYMRRGQDELAALAIELDKPPDDITLDEITQQTHPFAHLWIEATSAIAAFTLENLALIGQAAQGVPVKVTRTKVSKNGQGEEVVETTVEERVDRDWRAAGWLLERTLPHEYGRATKHELTGPDGGAIVVEVDVASSPAARLMRALEEMQERTEESEGVVLDVTSREELPSDPATDSGEGVPDPRAETPAGDPQVENPQDNGHAE